MNNDYNIITYSNILSAENYCLLRKSVEFHDIPLSHAKTALVRSDFIVAAYDENKPVGMARLMTDGTQTYVMDVVVLPNYQDKGIGRGLMERIVEFIKSIEYDTMLVNLLTNSDKTGFYEKFGFVKTVGMHLWLEKGGEY